MNAGRDVERLIAGWLREDSPGRAPDRILVGAAEVIDKTKQRRFTAAWREPMVLNAWRLTAAAVVVIAIGVGLGWLGRSTAAGPATGSPSPTSVPSTPVVASPSAVIADGVYDGPTLQVADIVAVIDADSKLTAAEHQDLIENVMGIQGARTLTISLELRAGRWTLRGNVDGNVFVGSEATFTFLDDHTLLLHEEPAGFSGFDVTKVGDGFTLRHLDEPQTEADAIVVRFLFESGVFTRRL